MRVLFPLSMVFILGASPVLAGQGGSKPEEDLGDIASRLELDEAKARTVVARFQAAVAKAREDGVEDFYERAMKALEIDLAEQRAKTANARGQAAALSVLGDVRKDRADSQLEEIEALREELDAKREALEVAQHQSDQKDGKLDAYAVSDADARLEKEQLLKLVADREAEREKLLAAMEALSAVNEAARAGLEEAGAKIDALETERDDLKRTVAALSKFPHSPLDGDDAVGEDIEIMKAASSGASPYEDPQQRRHTIIGAFTSQPSFVSSPALYGHPSVSVPYYGAPCASFICVPNPALGPVYECVLYNGAVCYVPVPYYF